MPITVFGVHTEFFDTPRKAVTSFDLTGFDNRNSEIFFQFPASVKDAVNIGVRCNGIDGIFLNKIAYGSRPLFTGEDSDYTYNPEFNESPLPLTSTLTGTSILNNANILVSTSVLPYSTYTKPADNSTWAFNHYLFHPDTDRVNADFFTDSDFTVTYVDTGSNVRKSSLANDNEPFLNFQSEIVLTKYPRWNLAHNPEVISSDISNVLFSANPPYNYNTDLPSYSKAVRVYSHDSNSFSGISVKELLTIENVTNTSGSQFYVTIDSSPTFKGIIASYMDVLQDNFNTVHLLQSFISSGTGTKQIDVKKGDLLFMFSNKNNPDVNTNNWYRLYTANLDENFQHSAFDINPYAGMRLEVHTFRTDALETIYSNNAVGNYNQGYHLRPVYDFDTLHQGTGSSDQIIIPKYYFSNIVQTQCIGYAFMHKLYDNTEFIASSPITIDITQDPRCKKTDTEIMPSTNKLVKALPGLNFTNIRPDDYCLTDNPDPTIRINGTNFFTRHIPIKMFNATDPSLVLVPNVLDYFIDDNEGEGQYSYYFHSPHVGPGGLSYFYKNTQNPENGCLVRFEVDGSYWVPSEAGFNRGGQQGVAMALEIDGFDAPKYRHSALSLSCINMVISTVDSDTTYLPAVEKQIPTHQPFYRSIINDINNDVWGWGIGSENVTFTNAQNGNGSVIFTNSVMGVPFLMIMIIFSSMVGYQRQHLPASLIIFFAIIGAATYLNLIELPVGIISGILVLVILGLFSRGFK